MRVSVGGDHAGFHLKPTIIEAIKGYGHEVTDYGCYDLTPVDFPDITRKVCAPILENKADRAVLVCGTGVGVCIAANKMPSRLLKNYSQSTQSADRLNSSSVGPRPTNLFQGA